MNQNNADIFTLSIFEGPLAFLLHLIQKSEINIQDVLIHDLTTQYLDRIKELLSVSIDDGTEFISMTAHLLLIKSKRLLPKHENDEELEEDLDPSFEIIHKLLEYCYFKETAKDLAEREEKQGVFFNRGAVEPPQETKKLLGIEHLSLVDLSTLFEKVLEKLASQKGKIEEEEWSVSDKIKGMRLLLKESKKVPFHCLFSSKKEKPELIVNFLALLELMKIGECFVGKEEGSEHIFVFEGSYDGRDDESTRKNC